MDVFDSADLLAIAEDEDSEDEVGAEPADAPESDDDGDSNAGGLRAEPEGKGVAGRHPQAETLSLESSSSDEDGFLESWFKGDAPPSTSNKSDHNCKQAKIDRAGATEVKLGSSVRDWIKSYNGGNSETARKLTGVVGVQDNNTWSDLKMIVGSESKGGKRSFQLEDSAGSKYTCENTISSSKFVDCLARYDEEKGAYILETVDWKLSNLKQKASRKRTAPSSAPAKPQGILDPRTRAKKAEESLKRLKRSSRPKPPARKASIPSICPPNNQKTNAIK